MNNTNDLEKVVSELEAHENPLLGMTVKGDSEIKKYLVEYTGERLDNEEITVNMIAEVMAAEFPEFVFALAEENFLRGYQMGLDDAFKTFTRETEEAAAEE